VAARFGVLSMTEAMHPRPHWIRIFKMQGYSAYGSRIGQAVGRAEIVRPIQI
jgi:hypothetical protein